MYGEFGLKRLLHSELRARPAFRRDLVSNFQLWIYADLGKLCGYKVAKVSKKRKLY